MNVSSKPLAILLLEDSQIDAELAGEYLRKGGIEHVLERVWAREDFVAALQSHRYDVILADYVLPAFDGISALEIAHASVPDTPFIFLSGTLGEEIAIDALKKGATDYVVKQRLDRLPSAVLRSVDEVKERVARQRAEEALRQLNATLEAHVEERTRKLTEAKERLEAEAAERERAETANREMAAQLHQAQKMETIGQLTGGVAHDFNNLLTIVIGNLETLQRHMPAEQSSRVTTAVGNAMRGAQRAASLTRSLLAFSRQQSLEPKPVDINRLVADMSGILERTLGEHVRIEKMFGDDVWHTHADLNQLESSLLNLAVNARDAMPSGGRLTIGTGNVTVDHGYCKSQLDAEPGDYVVISVSDEGRGMEDNVVEQAFEPFFTTKGVGQGTGLGLSQVYGFVRQTGGHVEILSEVGRGTCVKLFLPRHDGPLQIEAEDEKAAKRPVLRSAPQRVVLVVEDDEDLRAHSTAIVRELGYRVFEAGDGRSALSIVEEHPELDAIFTDIGLPNGMNGRQLAEKAKAVRPGIKVLFATGYALNTLQKQGAVEPGMHLVTKPFSYADLGERLSALFDETPEGNRVLIVEDDVLVRMVAVDELEAAGYEAVEAGSAGEAIEIFEADGQSIAAAIVDVGLPDSRGDALVARLRAIRADLPIIVASGYTEAQLRADFDFGGDETIAFVGKPYDGGQLAEKLSAVQSTPA